MSDFQFEFINPTVEAAENDVSVKKEPLIKCELEELNDQMKCGEIFAVFSGNFVLICGFCQGKFENMLDFGAHIKQKHEEDMQVIDEYLKSKLEVNTSVGKIEVDVISDEREESLHSFGDGLEPKSDVDSDGEGTRSNTNEADEQEKYTCDACGESYSSKADLQTHHKVECTRNSPEIAENANETQLKITSHTKRQRKRKHKDLATQDEQPIDGKDDMQDEQSSAEDHTVHKENKSKANPSATKKQFPCESCERVFKSKQSLSYHVGREHSDTTLAPEPNPDDPQSLRCKYCNQEFKTKEECSEHESTHSGEKPYICWYCNLTFKTSSGRKRHIRIHTGERPFQCNECPKGFDNKDQLESHIRKHKNPRKFTCQTCGESFFRRFQLGLHEQRRHTGFRPLVCEDCGKSFVTMGELTQHRIRHSDVKDWKCEVCGKCFYSKWALKDHMAGHSDEKPFGCEVCGRWFSRPKALKKHKKLHSDVKAYVCNICGKAYAQDSGLYAHKKTHGIRSSQ